MRAVLAAAAWDAWAEEIARALGQEWTLSVGWNQLGGAEALIATALPAELLPAARSLRVMAYPGAGATEIRASELPAGCTLVNVYEHEGPIAEYVLMTMLMSVTGVGVHAEAFRRGEWVGSGRNGGETHGELSGRTVGLFGYGHIGRAVASRAEAFGMRVLAVSSSSGSLDEMLPQCDFLVIAAPLTDGTRGRIGARELGLLPQGAYLVNVARAEIVAEEALYDALSSGRLSGAALDVWYRYPEPGHRGPGSRLPFHELANVLCTPHYSAWTAAMIRRRIARIAENLNRMRRGEPLERVVLEGTWTG